jgi:hypothetical protein
MLPTDSFSIGNSRSPAGSTLTDLSCESDRLTVGGPPVAAPDGALGPPCALVRVAAALVSGPSPGRIREYATIAAKTVAVATAALTQVFLL